jgi:hypothetical protein
MLKKLVTTAIAGAFAAVLAAPAAMACPGHESTVAKKEKADTTKTAEKDKAKKESPAKPDKTKAKQTQGKVVSKG